MSSLRSSVVALVGAANCDLIRTFDMVLCFDMVT